MSIPDSHFCTPCSGLHNQDQANADGASFGDACDNCPVISNDEQANDDQVEYGGVWDSDDDNDLVDDTIDDGQFAANMAQWPQ